MSLPTKGKILALDLGTRRTGVSISDTHQKVAFIREEIEHESTEALLKALKTLVEEEKICAFLVGLPLKLSGEKSPQTEKVLLQIQALKKNFSLPLKEIDERFSTHEAKAPKMKVVDSRSAQILLENYLHSRELLSL